jgi:hypothetical protein
MTGLMRKLSPMTQAMTVAEVLAGLERERTRLLDAVDALGEGAETEWVTEPGGWTAKDVLAHLIHYNGQIAFALGAVGDGPPEYVLGVTERLSGQEWSRRAVEFYRDWALADVRDSFVRNADMIATQVALLTDDGLLATDRVPWPGENRPLWQFIGHDTFLVEWPAHAEQMERAASRRRS